MARAQVQAELERDMAGEMTNQVVEQMQLNSYVMIAPEIVVSNIGIVAYEPCEDHNKVQIHNNMDVETATELRSIVELLVSRWELFDRLEHVRIHPDFIPWRPGSIENGQILCGSLQLRHG